MPWYFWVFNQINFFFYSGELRVTYWSIIIWEKKIIAEIINLFGSIDERKLVNIRYIFESISQ